MGQWLSERLGQSFVIENRPGAGSNIAVRLVVGAPAGSGFDIVARHMRHRRQRGSARCQLQECAAGKFHFDATDAVVRALPDGYTLVLVTAVNAISTSLYA